MQCVLYDFYGMVNDHQPTYAVIFLKTNLYLELLLF